MNGWPGPIAAWLAEVYLLSTVVLSVALLVMHVTRQPARRLAISRAALVSLVLLGPLSAGVRGTRWLAINRDGWEPRIAPIDRPGDQPSIVFSCPGPSPLPAATTSREDARLSAVLVLFAAGSGAMAAWLALGAIASARLAWRAGDAPEAIEAILGRVAGEGHRRPRLLLSTKVRHPMAVGLFRPAIVLPARFAEEEPLGRIEAALAHEWAHIRNGDLRLLAMGRLLLPLLFAHPLYVALRRRIRADQEALADAKAAANEGRIAYAEALVDWSRARSRKGHDAILPSLGLGGRASALARRIALLLDHDFHVEPSCPRPWRLGIRLASLAIVSALALASLNGSARLVLGASDQGPLASQGVPHIHEIGAEGNQGASAEGKFNGDCRCEK